MKMKKLIIILTALFFYTNVNAQLAYVHGGLNLANITKTNSGNTEKNNMLTTFNAGFMGRFGLSEQVDLETGLLYTGRGSKTETYFNGGNDYVKTKFNPFYIEVPLNLVFMIPFDDDAGAFFHAGPYAAFGVAGKATVDSKIGLVTTSSKKNIDFSNDDPTTSEQDDPGFNKLKRFDYGLNFGGGIQLKAVIFKVNYGLGLAKINSTASDNSVNDKNKYRTISISMGLPLH
jgi:hypothetical protein